MFVFIEKRVELFFRVINPINIAIVHCRYNNDVGNMYSYMYSVTVDLKLHCLCNTFIVRRIVQAKSIVHRNTFRFEKVQRNLFRQVPFVIEIVSYSSIRYLEKLSPYRLRF